MPQKTGVGVTEEKTAAAKAASQKDKKTARSASAKPDGYGDESITSLKGADRVRKRPGVIFGSDGLEGCEHSFFEILSNAVDEAREGHGSVIKVTYFRDLSIEVDDRGRGVPLGWNEREGRWNWDLIYCELYAGGKYDGTGDGNYEYALGLNGLGSCATQYSSEYMDVEVLRDISPLLDDEGFIGFENDQYVASGLTIAAEAHHPVIQAMIEEYKKLHFTNADGSLNAVGCPHLNTDVMERFGLVRNGQEQLVAGIHVYPADYFNPLDSVTGKLTKTPSPYHLA